jgi:hypothetical protein
MFVWQARISLRFEDGTLMEDVQQLALTIRRRAFEVLDGKESLTAFLETLWQLDSQKPDLLEQVAQQMEQDNGKWSSTSALPDITVGRDKAGRIGLITFTGAEAAKTTESGRKRNPIVWCSNRV